MVRSIVSKLSVLAIMVGVVGATMRAVGNTKEDTGTRDTYIFSELAFNVLMLLLVTL